ncbi:MAG: hypothetical protein MUF49_13385 [Oculatellaceae cyanobacterium Prado106]|jgi:hypothetical protein|nr:hypothetical protein [Oculatellaceae cyanobacterium Prado106]
MNTDIKLFENQQVKIEAWDFLLDAADRRKPNETNIHYSDYRRALVHNVGDKLTINYAGDYPGGVDIQGTTSIERLSVEKALSGPVAKLTGYSWFGAPPAISCFAQDLVLANRDIGDDLSATGQTGSAAILSNVALSHMPGDQLVINRGGGYTGGVSVEGNLQVGGITLQGSGNGSIDVNPLLPHQALKISNGMMQFETTRLRFLPGVLPHSVTTQQTLKVTSDTISVETHQLESGQSEVLDLVKEIKALRQKVTELEQAIAHLSPHR